MTAIVISCRRQDTKRIAGRISAKLTAKSGAGPVFMDTGGIAARVRQKKRDAGAGLR
jgi:hypothetical protein